MLRNTPVYELTLFGLVLILYLIYLYDIGKIQKLFQCSISPSEYFEKITSNYSNTIPLIFGKWSKLKKIYGIHNFLKF